LAALIASICFTSPARADAEDLAQRCIQAIHETMHIAVDRIHHRTAMGVRHIEHLDANGASDDELRESAARSIRSINATARAATARISRLAHHCIQELRDMDAPPPLIAAVRNAAEEANQRVETAAQHGRRAILEALDEALNN